MNLNTGDAVEYIEYLLKAARGGSYLSAEDKNALKALSDVITDFLTASQSGADGSQKLLAELCRLGEKDSSETVTNARFSAPVFSIDLEGSSVPDLSAPIMTMTDTADVGPQKAPTDAKTANEIKVQFGKCLGSGGEGSVYKIPSMPGKVAKIYRSGKFCNLSERKTMERKLHALMKKRGAGKIDGVSIAALPDELLYNGDGELIGYIMPQVLGSLKIYDALRQESREKYFPDLNFRGLIVIAYNLAEAVSALHRNNIIVGDMNQSNIALCQDGSVCLLDCDSFDITDNDTGERFPCTVGAVEMLAPELQRASSLKSARFTKESDRFSLAVNIFRLLMDNADPFTSATDLSLSVFPASHAILNGECVYVREVKDKEIPPWSPTLDFLPDEIHSLFDRTFNYNAHTIDENIARRPSADEWKNALLKFYQMKLTQCKGNTFHYYLPKFTECPYCKKRRKELLP